MKQVPTTIELQTKLSQDFRIAFELEDDDYKEGIDAISSVLAAQFRIMYMYAADNRNNLFPDTADTSEDGGELERLGVIYLNRQPRLATEGKYLVSLTGEAGTIIRESLTFKSNEDSNSAGNLFICDDGYEMTGTDDFIILRALVSGLSSLLLVGNKLTVTEPVLGLSSEVTVTEVIEKPISSEPISVYRKSVMDAIQQEPTGGSKTDYRLWASDAQGVRLVYPYVKEGAAGTMQVFVEAVKEDSEDGKGTPSQFILDSVREVINFDPDDSKETYERARIPMGVNLEVLPITLKPVDIELTGLSDSSLSIQQAIKDNIDTYLESIRPFIDGGDLIRNKNDILYNYRLSGIVQDVIGNSNYFENFKMKVDGNEESSFLFSKSNIPFFRNLIII